MNSVAKNGLEPLKECVHSVRQPEMDLMFLEVFGFLQIFWFGVCIFFSFHRLGLYWVYILELFKSHGDHS